MKDFHSRTVSSDVSQWGTSRISASVNWRGLAMVMDLSTDKIGRRGGCRDCRWEK